MLRDLDRIWPCDCLPAAALLALALLLSACGAGSTGIGTPTAAPAATAAPPPSTAAATPPPSTAAATPPPSTAAAAPPPSTAAAAPPPSSPSLKDKIGSLFSTAPKEARPVTAAAESSAIDCPFIDVRQGASTLTIPLPSPDGNNEAMAVQYQGIFVRAARDCKVVGKQMVMKIGVEGRIIVGPAGGPGQVDVPLRIAVVDQPTSGMKLIVTKLIRIPVMVAPGDGGATFTHVEDGLAFPLPTSNELAQYLVYIGFDPIGAQEQEKANLKPAPKGKPKPRVNPNAPTG